MRHAQRPPKKFAPIAISFFFAVQFVFLSGCASLPLGKSFQSEARETFPQTSAAISTASQIASQIAPQPFNAIPPLAEQLAILVLGAIAVWKHRRLAQLETRFNGSSIPKFPPPPQPPPA